MFTRILIDGGTVALICLIEADIFVRVDGRVYLCLLTLFRIAICVIGETDMLSGGKENIELRAEILPPVEFFDDCIVAEKVITPIAGILGAFVMKIFCFFDLIEGNPLAAEYHPDIEMIAVDDYFRAVEYFDER